MSIREEKLDLDAKITFGTVNINLGEVEKDCLLFNFGPEFDLPRLSKSQNLEGFFVAYQLKDNKGLKLTLQGKSRHGNPINFKNEEIDTSSSDETILTVTEEDGFISIVPVGPIGTAQVQVSVPGVLHNGAPLSGTFDVQVIPGDAVFLVFEPAETFDLPDVIVPPVEPTA